MDFISRFCTGGRSYSSIPTRAQRTTSEDDVVAILDSEEPHMPVYLQALIDYKIFNKDEAQQILANLTAVLGERYVDSIGDRIIKAHTDGNISRHELLNFSDSELSNSFKNEFILDLIEEQKIEIYDALRFIPDTREAFNNPKIRKLLDSGHITVKSLMALSKDQVKLFENEEFCKLIKNGSISVDQHVKNFRGEALKTFSNNKILNLIAPIGRENPGRPINVSHAMRFNDERRETFSDSGIVALLIPHHNSSGRKMPAGLITVEQAMQFGSSQMETFKNPHILKLLTPDGSAANSERPIQVSQAMQFNDELRFRFTHETFLRLITPNGQTTTTERPLTVEQVMRLDKEQREDFRNRNILKLLSSGKIDANFILRGKDEGVIKYAINRLKYDPDTFSAVHDKGVSIQKLLLASHPKASAAILMQKDSSHDILGQDTRLTTIKHKLEELAESFSEDSSSDDDDSRPVHF